MKISTCSSGAHPARISQSQGNDWDLKVGEACSLSTLYDCVLSLESAGLCGKMSPLLFPAAEARISDDLFPCSVDGISRSLKADGENAESSLRLREDSEWHGELDSQFTRVEQFPRAIPQRRKRLFLVGYTGQWKYPAKVLFDGEMCGGDTPPRRTKRQNASAGSEGGSASTDWWDGSQKAGTLTRTSDQQFMPDKGRLQCVIEQTGTDFLCYENHAPDSRIKSVEVSQSIVARMGTGGNNLPLLQEVPREPETAIGFIKNDAGGDLQGFWNEVFPTMRTEVTPAVAREECFHVSFCDANGRRKDRPNGGLYVTEAKAGKTVTAGGPGAETVIVEPIALDGDKMKPGERSGGSGMGVSEDGVMYTQTVKDVHAVAYDECVPLDLRNATRDPEKHDAQNRQGVGIGEDGASMNTVTAASVPGVGWQATVRKLLPIECERLMGLPDNWTRISWKGKPEEECPDAPRYKACGNSMCVNVMAWIGERIEAVNQKLLQMK